MRPLVLPSGCSLTKSLPIRKRASAAVPTGSSALFRRRNLKSVTVS